MVSSTSIIDDGDYNDAAGRIAAVLGNGSGQTGYGQRVNSIENPVSNGNFISHTEWNRLIGDINVTRNHQSGSNALNFTFDGGEIVGADASGASVTRSTTQDNVFTIDNPDQAEGVNDIIAAVGVCESNASNILSDDFTATDPTSRTFIGSTRFSPWNTVIQCELDVEFTAQYDTTETDGTVTTLDGTTNDHRRHFFNTGGKINLSIRFASPSSSKDVIWANMLSSMDYITFEKNKTVAQGTGRAADGLTDVDYSGGVDSAVGNYQLTTVYKLIYKRFADPGNSYSENYIEVYAKRVGQNTIRFQFLLNDVDSGDPNFDERVQEFGGTISAGIDLYRATGNVSVPEPTGRENDSFE